MKNLALSCLALWATVTGAVAADKIRVLILTGESDYSHPWQPNVQFLRSMLVNTTALTSRSRKKSAGLQATLANYCQRCPGGGNPPGRGPGSTGGQGGRGLQ